MSLQTRLTALAQAVGADIKDVRAKLTGPAGGDLSGTYPNPTVKSAAGDLLVTGTVYGKGAVPAGGALGQVLSKKTATDQDLQWVTQAAQAALSAVYNDPFNNATASPVNVPSAIWTVLPVPTVMTITKSDGVNPDFTRNADGSVTINKPGVYQLNTTVGAYSNVTPGPSTTITVLDMRFVLTAANKATTHDQTDPMVTTFRDLVPGSDYPIKSEATTFPAVAGQRVGCITYQAAGAPANLAIMAFSLVRSGGQKGDKGDTGGVLGANSFRQLAASAPGATNNWRTIWVSATNEMDPAGAFTRNADGSVTIRDSGWYSVSATFRNVTANALCTFALTDTLNSPGNPFALDTKSLGSNYSNSMGADNYFAAGAKIYPNVWTDVSTQIELTYFAVSRLGGTKGDKGDAGGNATVPIDSWHNVGAAGEPAFASGWSQATPPFRFRKDPLGRVWLTGNPSGTTGTTIFTLPVGYRPIIGQYFPILQQSAVSGGYLLIGTDGSVISYHSSGPGPIVDLSFDTGTVTQMPTGPQGAPGAKGDPGGINVVKTLDWNTTLTPNFYRSTNDFMERTLHGPGDQLNPPPQAGIVVAHENGDVTQRVWDMDTHLGWTRHRLYDGSWTAWAADLVKPDLWVDLMVGGAAPLDGDERYFQSAAMLAQGVIWRFRYHKAQNKWHFIGGSELLFSAAGISAVAGAQTTDAANLAFTATLSGSYDVTWGARMYQNPSGASSGNILLYADQMRSGSAMASPALDLWAGPIAGQTWSTVVQGVKTFRFDSVQNADIIRLRSQSINYNAALETPIMRIRPVSVIM